MSELVNSVTRCECVSGIYNMYNTWCLLARRQDRYVRVHLHIYYQCQYSYNTCWRSQSCRDTVRQRRRRGCNEISATCLRTESYLIQCDVLSAQAAFNMEAHECCEWFSLVSALSSGCVSSCLRGRMPYNARKCVASTLLLVCWHNVMKRLDGLCFGQSVKWCVTLINWNFLCGISYIVITKF